jgi:hypothetical protein
MSDEESRRSAADDRHQPRSHSHHSREQRKVDGYVIDGSSPLSFLSSTAKHS